MTAGRLDLREGKTYLPPDRTYPNLQIDKLEQVVRSFLKGEVSEESVFEVAEELEETGIELLDTVPRTLSAAVSDQQFRDDELLHQLPYLLGTGAELLNGALEELDRFLGGEDLEAEAIIAKLRESNNYLCHSANVIQTLFSEAADAGS